MTDNKSAAVCSVCGHSCRLREGQYGLCGARKNRNGKIVCINYGRITSLALDPVEKKPLARFFPGSRVLSAGSFGCNMSCPFCQNHQISKDIPLDREAEGEYRRVSSEELVRVAEEYRRRGNTGIAFTYNEPLVGWEFVRDTARLAQKRGLKSIMVTNGFGAVSILEELLPYIDAMNIDLKGFTEEYYEKLGGSLEMVKAFIERAAAECHVELTTLVVPGENDSEEEMDNEARWIASVDHNIPLHVTRFFPMYKMKDRRAADVRKVYALKRTAEKYLKYVYTGNC